MGKNMMGHEGREIRGSKVMESLEGQDKVLVLEGCRDALGAIGWVTMSGMWCSE